MKRISGRGKKRGFLRRDESGQVLVIVALGAVFLIGMAALAVDVSHGLVVRNELQNAADASALAGAGNLFLPSPGPDWARAEGAASASIAWNKSDGKSLVNCQVQSGYWNLSQSPAGLQPQGITPGPQDVPAVKVLVRKADGQNGGPMPTYFARIFGLNSIPVQAQAVAVVSNPGYVKKGALLPVAISKEFAERFRDYKDPAHKFIIGSPYHYPNGLAGQWTSLNEQYDGSNNVPFIRDLIVNGNSQQINVNTSGTCPGGNPNSDCIYIQPGTKNTLYANGNQPSISQFEGQDVLLPVVDAILRDTTHGWAPVSGFVGFHVTKATGGSIKTIEGHFVDGFTAPKSGGAGPNYGALTPIHLVQ